MKDLLTDDYLKALVGASKSQEVLDLIYGSPVSVTQKNDVKTTTYNIAVHDEVLRQNGGLIGFVASFKDGIFTSWTPVIQVNE